MAQPRPPGDETHEVTIFHNPSCSNSRGALGVLTAQSVDVDVIEYLVDPPSRQTLEMVISKLVDPVADLVRTTDKRFVDLGLRAADYRTAEQVIELLLAHPELMQRPVVVKGGRAVIARPGDRVVELLN